MSKLDEIAQTLKSDTATSEELYSMNSAQLAMRFITLREWMREVLPVALAAEAAINQYSCYDLRIGFLQVFEADNMHATAQEFQKHIDVMEKIEDALKEIQS